MHNVRVLVLLNGLQLSLISYTSVFTTQNVHYEKCLFYSFPLLKGDRGDDNGMEIADSYYKLNIYIYNIYYKFSSIIFKYNGNILRVLFNYFMTFKGLFGFFEVGFSEVLIHSQCIPYSTRWSAQQKYFSHLKINK